MNNKILKAGVLMVAGLMLTGCGTSAGASLRQENLAKENQTFSASKVTGGITAEDAKAIALKDAGLGASDVIFIHVQYEVDDGVAHYDVEFYKELTEYDYEVAASTGAIISKDMDAEGYDVRQAAAQTTQADQTVATTPQTQTQTQTQTPTQTQVQVQTPQVQTPQVQPQPQASSGDIGLERAKSIALGRVSGASASNIVKAKQDWDDGRLEYEITIILNSMEYEFEIRASDGAIISSDIESIYD